MTPKATNLQIDDRLIQKAVKLGGHKTKKVAVSQALIEYIQHLEQEKVISLFGVNYNYKNQGERPRKFSLTLAYGLWL